MKKEDLIKKAKIDDFDELDNYFELSSIKDEEFILRQIRRKIVERFDFASEILNNFLHPDTTIMDINDADSLDLADREKMVDMLKELSIVIKKNQILELDSKDELEREFIKNSFLIYKKIIPDVKFFISKTSDTLIKNDERSENINYLG